LITQQTENLVLEAVNIPLQGAVLIAQECKLRAEFDLTMANVTRTNSENQLMQEKIVTEKAQTQAMGVDEDSVVGKQKTLYQAQIDGYARDAEQKATKIMVDTWNSRRLTDDATTVNAENGLQDPNIGRAVTKLLTGVGA